MTITLVTGLALAYALVGLAVAAEVHLRLGRGDDGFVPAGIFWPLVVAGLVVYFAVVKPLGFWFRFVVQWRTGARIPRAHVVRKGASQ